MRDRHCLFCDIIARVESAFIVYENAHAIVFLDKHPINVGHVLVVPPYHVESFYALAEDAFIELMRVVRRVAPVIGAAYQPRKVGMLAAGFDVAHAHIHVLPLYESHDLTSKVILEGRRVNPSEKELRMAAEHIQEGLHTQGDAAI
jgi:histidine triad (HIT) family protein